jgi:hypothetical protein
MWAQTPPVDSDSPLGLAEVDRCVSAMRRQPWPAAGPGPPVVIATFATALPPEWWLGASASLFGIPLVVIGLGKPWGGMSKAVIKKFYAVRRAAQLLRRLVPSAAILVCDAWDVMVINGVTPAVLPLLGQLGRGERMLVSGECNSWPRCYRDLLAVDNDSA